MVGGFGRLAGAAGALYRGPYQFTDTTNHRALTATFEKICISDCFVCSTPIKSRLNILHGGSQLEQPESC